MNTETLDIDSTGKRPIFPIKQRWTLLMIGMIISFAMVVTQVMDVLHLSDLLNRIDQGDSGAAREITRMQKEGLTPYKILMFLVGVLSVVFLCMWFYRASQNVREAGMRGLNYSPGWNVGWFFIPLVHIVMPALVVRETVRASLSINDRNEYNGWQNNKALPAFSIWAICFCLRMLITYVTVFYMFSYLREVMERPGAMVEMMKSQLLFSYITVGLTVLEGVALLVFSKKITDIQEQYRAN